MQTIETRMGMRVGSIKLDHQPGSHGDGDQWLVLWMVSAERVTLTEVKTDGLS